MINSRGLTSVVLIVCALYVHIPMVAETGSYTVFRSQDQGRTWSRSDAGLPSHARINAFARTQNAVLVGTNDGIYISRDQGSNWKMASGAANGHGRILSFATVGSSAYAGTDRNAILVSLDGGVNWEVNAGIPFHNVRTLLVHDGALYAGTDTKGVFVSRDSGRSWTSIGEGLPMGAQIFSMVSHKGKIFAGLYSKGLYVWEGRGPSWRKVDPVSPLVLAATGQTLLAGHNPGGIFRSDDSGQTWMTSEIPFSADLGKAPVWELGADPNLALAGVASGIYYSDDHGRTWITARAGLPDGSSGISFLVDRGFVLAGVFVRHNQVNRPIK